MIEIITRKFKREPNECNCFIQIQSIPDVIPESIWIDEKTGIITAEFRRKII